ncbi:hypothetical protein ID856_14425 [Xenorhabdus sp. 18]|uniref:hypothetical protein n=1 Tax=Xenorhabdus doucetiae TaxID=351671 RepID=UPI0019CB724E|nr:hypothetical protein [Xenorhabdus sp. 18]MBD2797721.1 hypothetical protein [Xenorhabdus sp. 18]
MTDLNFEAIGRCKVLREKIGTLYMQRYECVYKLRNETSRLTGTHGCISSDVEALDIDFIHSLINDIAAVDKDLTQAIYEFNYWGLSAGEQPIRLNLPVRETEQNFIVSRLKNDGVI